uniref:AAA_11 domain-containing protein n=1 Tax=Caenorhabditis tropicalis TaxID=1561998 RepID=A0A1I7TXA6_9PELO
MSNTVTHYSGFFLGHFPRLKYEHPSIKVAVFKANTEFRRIMELSPYIKPNKVYGSMIHFSSKDIELEDKSHIEIEEGYSDEIYIQEEDKLPEISYQMKNVDVRSADLPKLHSYKHSHLGMMIDKQSLMQPGRYTFVKFVVKDEGDTFHLEIVDGKRIENHQNLDVAAITEKFSNIHKPIKVEHAYYKKSENESWATIGHLKLVGYQNDDINGLRPMFRIVDKKQSDLLKKISNNKAVVMRKQRLVNGNYVDDCSKTPQCATLSLCDNKKIVIAKLDQIFRHKFEFTFAMEEIFRFEPSLVRATLDNHHTVHLQNVIENLEMDPENLMEMSDGCTQKYELNNIQYQAIRMALNEERKLVFIQGGPGTGKTYVLTLILAKLVSMNKQAVVFLPTKRAMRNIQEMTRQTLENKKIPTNRRTLMDAETFADAINFTKAGDEAKAQQQKWRKMVEDGKMSPEEATKNMEDIIRTTKTEVEQVSF